ncbi:MAG: ferritin-like domain-containing protein [Oscillibacter sp.]|nr:ferritin-like domain-containing protein [Oscillibacter sp.]
MDQTPHTDYDFRRYDRIWRRVSPTLEPYPTTAAAPETTALAPRQEAQLPGAEQDPCCMGSAAAEMLEVLTGYIEEELSDQRYYQALQRFAPAWARSALQRLAEEEGRHAKRLMAVHYLITARCYRPAIPCGCIRIEGWCPALRKRYHEEACGALNYARSAEGTTDICLQRILEELSRDEYRHAETVARLLERSLQC